MSDSTPSRVRRLLIIDSDAITTGALKQYFGQQGFDVSVVPTGAEGAREAVARLPALILLAATLSDGPGLEVFKQLRGRVRTAHIPVMFLANHSEADLQNALLGAGADDFILKPFDIDILGLRIRNAIKRSERDGVNHPRSGLPTGRLIQERVRALADEFGWYKIDFTIANFEAFRDLYGFMSGEEVLTFATRLVGEVMQRAGTPDDFVGQRSDTEFVIVARLDNGPIIRGMLERRFNEEVTAFYSFVEREQGYIEAEDGAGGRVHKALITAHIKVQQGDPDDDEPPVSDQPPVSAPPKV
jgi:DNA-binding response OmpR family regulator